MRDHLVFYLNGARLEVRGPAVGRTLTDFLRYGDAPSTQPLTGTKVACAEGDCGACTVLVGRPDPATRRLVYQAIDACIAFVYQMDGAHVLTVESLAVDRQLSDVQQAMVDCHGSQCGFCTPGFVMALHGLRANQPSSGLSEEELRVGLSGNLCRCTGYAQILEAAHSIESCAAEPLDDRYDAAQIATDLAARCRESVHVNAGPSAESNGKPQTTTAPVEAFVPATLQELIAARAARPDARLVAGATDLGVQHNHGKIAPQSVIVMSRVPELNRLDVDEHELVIGAAVTWRQIEQATADALPEYSRLLSRFGSPQVRHAGTLGGNLANASPIADSIPLHMVAESTLRIAGPDGSREVPIEDFYLGYKELDLHADEVLESVTTPLPGPEVQLTLHKVSKRRDMDISTVTAAFWLDMQGQTIREARVALGGVGPVVVRARRAEAALQGQRLSLDAMRRAGRAARDEVAPISDVRGSAAYRLQLVENLFVKCLHDLSEASEPASRTA
ncbi:4-hydroxybenzoyl-CoA reductase subunit gamma [Posidoniimonas corsicana]|uniref:4-hydroxybenzoyl-CoA reductase subunit gamma n=1 Tax=Posidoniimonas corsicana TaxID=1938618 RepID=A0A5C5VD65_9BACT|nr:FAD binding domain-containing protein [Posidoniimonas corsicana]TWT35900.1 4-hydroxybenzoyl-CoA reductase subunit gamma [Posidoniimonas corsicana]